jgi:hypothetical protein
LGEADNGIAANGLAPAAAEQHNEGLDARRRDPDAEVFDGTVLQGRAPAARFASEAVMFSNSSVVERPLGFLESRHKPR